LQLNTDLLLAALIVSLAGFEAIAASDADDPGKQE
jgi:hypothetical protein